MGCLRLDILENHSPLKVVHNSLKENGNTCAGAYLFGFNGQETDPETGFQNYKYRMYDSRIARFFAVDPLTKDYPELTPYQFASNSPIYMIELEGLEGLIAIRIEDMPKDFNSTVFCKELEQRLIESGAHSGTRVVVEGSKEWDEMGSWDRFWDFESDQSATITIRKMNYVRDAGSTDAGGYGEDNEVVIFTGLHPTKTDRKISEKNYVNVALHELGHAVYDFFGKEKTDKHNGLGHDLSGDSKLGTDIMDYDVIQEAAKNKEDAYFSDEQKSVIKDMANEEGEN